MKGFHFIVINFFYFLCREKLYCPAKLSCGIFLFLEMFLLFSQVWLEQIFELYVFYYELVYQVLILIY